MTKHTNADAAAGQLAAIETTLARMAGDDPSAGWKTAWDDLAREGVAAATPEQRLTCWVAVRASGALPPDAGLYLVAQEGERLAWRRVEAEVAGAREEFAAARARRDLEEWGGSVLRPLPGADWFRARYPLDWAKRFHAALVRHAGADVAALFRDDPAGFAARYRAGRRYFEPPAAAGGSPGWVRRLADRLGRSGCLRPERPGARLHIVRASSADPTEVVLAYWPVVTRRPGGVTVVRPVPYVLDVGGAARAFDAVDEVRWVPFGNADRPDAPFVSLEGTAEGNRVRVRVLAGWLPGREGPP